MDLNKVMLIGRIWNELKIQSGKSWKAYLKLSLATSRWKDLPTDWHNIILFWATAEAISKYGEKWAKVYIEWSIQVDQTEKNWEKKTYYNIVWQKCILLNNKETGNSNDVEEEELPF